MGLGKYHEGTDQLVFPICESRTFPVSSLVVKIIGHNSTSAIVTSFRLVGQYFSYVQCEYHINCTDEYNTVSRSFGHRFLCSNIAVRYFVNQMYLLECCQALRVCCVWIRKHNIEY